MCSVYTEGKFCEWGCQICVTSLMAKLKNATTIFINNYLNLQITSDFQIPSTFNQQTKKQPAEAV